jgi:triosephosphate isomerase
MPTPIVAGNWKMNTMLDSAEQLAGDLRTLLDGVGEIETVVFPPFVYLQAVRTRLEGSNIAVGAQNMHFEERGAFTGEIAPSMVSELCSYVILGHSERRHLFGETDEDVNRKLRAAIDHGLRSIVCIGETLAERQAGRIEEVIVDQIQRALAGVESPGDVVFAYEPVWAIGTGEAANPKIAREVMGDVILRSLTLLYGESVATQIPLLYGGSVNVANIDGFILEESIHGVLVGNGSLRADDFAEMVRITAAVKGTMSV